MFTLLEYGTSVQVQLLCRAPSSSSIAWTQFGCLKIAFNIFGSLIGFILVVVNARDVPTSGLSHSLLHYDHGMRVQSVLLRGCFCTNISSFLFDRLSQYLLTLDFNHYNKVDPPLFIYNNGDVLILLFVYIDNTIIIGSNATLMESLITQLGQEFALKDLETVLHHFLSLEVKYFPDGLFLAQTKYTRHLLERSKMLARVLEDKYSSCNQSSNSTS